MPSFAGRFTRSIVAGYFPNSGFDQLALTIMAASPFVGCHSSCTIQAI
jgi:hypothetical protein